MRTSACREQTCGVQMIWTTGPKGGRMPVDAAPSETGPYMLMESPGSGCVHEGCTESRPHVHALYAPEGYAGDRHASHFSTCPAARKFSKNRGGKDRGPRQEKYVVGPTQPARADMQCPECHAVFANAPVDANCGGACFETKREAVKLVRAS